MQKLLRRNPFASTLLAIICLLALSAGASAQSQTNNSAAAQEKAVSPQPAAMPQMPSGVADKFVTIYGAKIHYLESGSGPAVMLPLGLRGDTSNWLATIGPLAQKYRVIVPDQIGFGRSDKPMINYRVGTLVDFLD